MNNGILTTKRVKRQGARRTDGKDEDDHVNRLTSC